MFFPHFVGDAQTIMPLTMTRREYAWRRPFHLY
jgi:hypothetical protein